MPKKPLLVYVPATWTKVAKTTRNSNLQVESRFKLTHFKQPVLSQKTELKVKENRGYIYTFSFLAKIVTTTIWPSGVLDYSNKNDNWTITPLSHIPLMSQYYFFFTSINYNEEKTSHSKKTIIKVQKGYDEGACHS